MRLTESEIALRTQQRESLLANYSLAMTRGRFYYTLQRNEHRLSGNRALCQRMAASWYHAARELRDLLEGISK